MSSDTVSTVCDPRSDRGRTRVKNPSQKSPPKGPGQTRLVPQRFTATARSTPIVPPQVQQQRRGRRVALLLVYIKKKPCVQPPRGFARQLHQGFPLPLALAPPHCATDGRRKPHGLIPATHIAHGTRPARTAPAVRCALAHRASSCTPLSLAPPAPSRSQVPPLPLRSRETRPLLSIRHPCPTLARTSASHFMLPTLARRRLRARRSKTT